MRKSFPILMIGMLLQLISSHLYGAEPFSWESQPSPPVSNIYELYNYSGTTLFAATDSGVYQFSPQGNWELSGLRGHNVWTINADTQGYLFAGVSDSGLYRSDNQGKSWQHLNPDIQYVRSIVVNKTDLIFAGTYYDGVYRSSDHGDTWTQNGLRTQHIRTLFISSAGTLFAGTDGSKIYRSSNNGTGWQFIGNDLDSPYAWCFTEDAAQQIFVGTSNGIYLSGDDGASWHHSGLKDQAIWGLLTTTNNELLASAWKKGVFMSQDDGNHWLNIGLDNQEIWDFVITAGHDILACTHSGKILKLIREPAAVAAQSKPDSTAIRSGTTH